MTQAKENPPRSIAEEMVSRLSEDWVPEDTFALRLMRLRKSLGLLNDEIAPLCGVSAASWSNWERGMKPVRITDAVEKIARGTKVSRDWLLFGDGAQNRKVPNRRIRDVANAA